MICVFAGRFDGGYFSAVSSFGWAALHERAPGIINALLDFWASRYRFVLIDSSSVAVEIMKSRLGKEAAHAPPSRAAHARPGGRVHAPGRPDAA